MVELCDAMSFGSSQESMRIGAMSIPESGSGAREAVTIVPFIQATSQVGPEQRSGLTSVGWKPAEKRVKSLQNVQ